MTEKPSPESPDDKAKEDVEASMERFRNLARRLLSVSPAEVAEEQVKYDAEEERKRRPRLTPN